MAENLDAQLGANDDKPNISESERTSNLSNKCKPKRKDNETTLKLSQLSILKESRFLQQSKKMFDRSKFS